MESLKRFIAYKNDGEVLLIGGTNFFDACHRSGIENSTNVVDFYTDVLGPRYVFNDKTGKWDRGDNPTVEKLFSDEESVDEPEKIYNHDADYKPKKKFGFKKKWG